jgi:histidyl-tRNA synthetase
MVLQTLDRDGGGGWRLAFDPTLVRGMSYYTGPIFEVASSEFSSSIAGGGRYDELIGKILGQDVPATGFSIGFERVILLLMERRARAAGARQRIALIFEEDKDDLATVLAAARTLRADGLLVSIELRARKLGAQLAALSAQGFDGFAIFDGTPRPPIRRFSDEDRQTPDHQA